MNSNEAASWVQAERNDRSNRETKKRLKGIKWTTITIKVPVCPKCNNPMQHELDPSSRLLWKWVCSKCRYSI